MMIHIRDDANRLLLGDQPYAGEAKGIRIRKSMLFIYSITTTFLKKC